MDFPISLESKRFVSGKEELEQVIFISLSQRFGTILHDERKGTNLSVHRNDVSKMKLDVQVTFDSIKGVELKNVQVVSDDHIEIEYIYNGNIENYNYYLD